MKRFVALAFALLVTPALAKEVRTTIGVSCVVIASSAGTRTASVSTTRPCGPNCVLKTTIY